MDRCPKRALKQRSRKQRAGYVLVIVVLLLFALFGLAALVVDMGFARTAQGQMQTSVDAAALEGLRWRDAVADEARRQAAADTIGRSFDDNLDPADGDPRGFGAGPMVEFSGGVDLGDGFSAAQTMSIPNSPVYKPTPSLNTDNLQDGDMVAGFYTNGPGTSHREGNNYTRDDFTADADGDAFLVRLRRTGELGDGVSREPGPRIPILLGRGGLISNRLKGSGVAVRATAIATPQRARTVGAASVPHQLPGATPFVIHRSAWETAISGGMTPWIVEWRTDGSIVDDDGETIGYAISDVGRSRRVSLGEPTTITPPVDPAACVAAALAQIPPDAAYAYLPIVSESASPLLGRTVGFVLVSMVDDVTGGDDTFVIRPLAQRIASENASATLMRPLDGLFRDAAPDPDLQLLWNEHRGVSAPLMAAALSR